MILVFFSALLFGLVHPGSKLIMADGLDLVTFCLLYVMFRLLAQLPVTIATRAYRIETAHRHLWPLLIALGGAGAALQFTEFKGIAAGLPVPLVTFLVYTHPIWSSLLSVVINREPWPPGAGMKLALGMGGILLVTGTTLTHVSIVELIAPLSAGLFIALWVSLSSRARQGGVPAWTVSFYYDLFAVIALFVLWMQDPGTMAPRAIFTWLGQANHLLEMVVYAVLIGVVPNFLFYKGSLQTGARAAGLMLLLEPVIATLCSHWIWHDHFSTYFYFGTILILFSGVPMLNISKRVIATCALFSFCIAALFAPQARASMDQASVHGMLIFGNETLYLSHLPMFHHPHDYQVILKVELPNMVVASLKADQLAHAETKFYTFVPQMMVLPDVVSGKLPFSGDLYRGHFEQGGVRIQRDVHVKIAEVVYFKRFVLGDVQPSELSYFLFGTAVEKWAAHLITAPPDFDQIISVTTQSEVTLPSTLQIKNIDPNQPLTEGTQFHALSPEGASISATVQAAPYLEFGDLSL